MYKCIFCLFSTYHLNLSIRRYSTKNHVIVNSISLHESISCEKHTEYLFHASKLADIDALSFRENRCVTIGNPSCLKVASKVPVWIDSFLVVAAKDTI